MGGADLYDGRAVLPAIMYCTTCPAKELLNCELLALPAAVILLNENVSSLVGTHKRQPQENILHREISLTSHTSTYCICHTKELLRTNGFSVLSSI